MPSYNQPPQGPPMPMYNEGPGPQIISQGQPMPIYNDGPQNNGIQQQPPQLYGNEIGNSGEFQSGRYQPRQMYPGNAPNAKALRQ
ncbi:unnamed protein product [Cylicostephanus goldi]|uniref:Uncharacterized protein n=1 Tax=Cylicostephanus goldi TaxID=71465 RepID=A0A3P6TVM1_CYLGO|nr:unnamed protein product [Cylicostephanus goldi]